MRRARLFSLALALSTVTVAHVAMLEAQVPRQGDPQRPWRPSGTTMARDDVHFPEHPWLVVRSASTSVSTTGGMEVTAECRSGEILIGGGYRMPRPPLDIGSPLIIEGSYPAAPSKWRVIAHNPDPSASGRNRGTVVTAEAYCLTKPIASVRIVSSGPVSIGFARTEHGLPAPVPITASCPAGSVLTAGGFLTTHTKPYAGLYNAWLSAVEPRLDSGSPVAAGWRVVQAVIEWPPPPPPPTTTIYALCASGAAGGIVQFQGAPPGKGLQSSGSLAAGPTRSATIPQVVAPIYYGYHEGFVSCGSSRVARPSGESRYTPDAGVAAVGGGYRFSGSDYLVPHHVYQNVAVAGFSGWSVGGIHGGQSGPGGIQAYAVCLKLPPVYLTVRIISPPDRSAPALAAPRGGGRSDRTELLTFQALAGDASGNLVPGATFRWTIDGIALGTGESLTASLPADPCRIVNRRIQVTAADPAGHSATAAATLFVGGVC